MSTFDISLIGGEQLQQIFSALPDRIEKKILTAALKDGAEYLAFLIANKAPRSASHRGAGQHMADTFRVVPLRARKGRIGVAIMPGTRAELGIESVAQAAQRQQSQRVYKGIVKALRQRGVKLSPQGRGHIRKQLGLDSTYFYPVAVEVGTRKMRPRSFMRGPLHAAHDAVLAVIAQSLDAGIERELLKG